MEVVNIHDAKTRLSRLLEEVQEGKPFIIAKSGKPIARVTSVEAPEPGKTRRIGFLAGQIKVPEDFDRMGEAEILSMFGEDDAPSP
ncbi:prevent-host-death protein [Thiohalorhabdus denitrificans]|uniref:Antitoxin n=1 Tax=Thiohalorhabdus denitrificans TaxID=381306 RepID=A0A0P9CRG2_9GAMM|nr:type II toxin-antitoxin system prevent-host-death family antitoxin [Thiohalorhabdus denitrificans]KPV39262.1 prevent-host-death protein [Thiohalorhabdus denitrificans]SCX79438.1 prevent-host-death family protein [Thiohalorhabdus denitrificans]